MSTNLRLMTQDDWKDIKHFSPHENWGDWTKMYYQLFVALEKLRVYVNRPIVIHCGYDTSGHTRYSYHYVGMAVDLHIVGLHIIDQFISAVRIDEFNGIGVYPHWKHPGLHLDIREKDKRFDTNSMWLAIYENNKQVYKKLDSKNIKLYCY